MSADFWAGYISGAVGVLIGNPLDIVKVQLQSGLSASLVTQSRSLLLKHIDYVQLTRGAAAPILGYGALNALLFVAYNRTLVKLDPTIVDTTNVQSTSLAKIWVAGATGGLASWLVSVPTELVKCRTQLGQKGESSWSVAQEVWKKRGVSGFYLGGGVTSIRDAVGYGFYFWSYEVCKRLLSFEESEGSTCKILLSGGIAGVATWVSIFPLDVIKTRLQCGSESGRTATVSNGRTYSMASNFSGALHIAKEVYLKDGIRVFFRGLGVCSARAFIVNACQWSIYEWTVGALKPIINDRQRT